MGCTLDVLVLCGPNAFLAHVGDARVYLARPAATIQLTGDHTLHGALMARGVTTPSTPPSAGRALTNIVGREQPPHVDEIFLELCPGDRLVLCTDGVYSELRDEAALSAIALSGAPDAAAAALVNAALQNHGRDNATALVIEVCQQRLQRPLGTESSAERDFVQAAQCAILAGLPQQMAAHALQSAIEVRFAPGEPLPRAHANDRVGYILLEGTVTTPRGLSLAVPALIYPESLAGGGHGPELCVAQQYVRAFRIRADDLREVCASNTALAAAIYERLARHLARLST
jgi:protein phosphatase